MIAAPPLPKRDDEDCEYDPFPEPVYAYDEEGYAYSDGLPMAETPQHRREMNDSIQCLEWYYAEEPDVYTSGNDFIHYRKGDRNAKVSPDCWVVKGVAQRERKNFKIWEEGNAPCVVIEFSSRYTYRKDLEEKFTLYEQELKTNEYFLFDPEDRYLSPRLQGYRLQAGRYVAIAPDTQGRLWSEELGLWLETVEDRLRYFDPKTGAYLPNRAEIERDLLLEKQRAEAEQQRADMEASLRAQLEAENARLRAELAAAQKPPRRKKSGQE